MPFFVPILRTLMLFLNVYDSYKTLKDPPSSTRNGGRPTVRAISQRKRDMKGCLAVWIVWCCLSMYERMLEGIICLFIPFYHEFKSLVLLFLILTRARGAEPIYLHFVRPIIKPYTKTIDATLELLLMVGDFVFALATYPLDLALKWWYKRFGTHYEPLDTEPDTQGGSSEDVDTSEVPTSFLASSSRSQTELDVDQPEAVIVQLPPKVISKTSHVGRRQSSNDPRSHNSGSRIHNTLHNRNTEASSATNSKKETRHQRTLPPQKNSKVVSSSAVNSDNMEPLPSPESQRVGGEALSRHQIWYPPRSSYINDGEDQGDLTLRPSDLSVPSKDSRGSQEAVIVHEQQQLDEWRQYPAFPSAYPPTPLVVTSIVRSSTIYPPIEEEISQQDFHKSLLPPREPLNPSPAGDSSDQSFTFGISPYNIAHQATTTDEADDSMSTEDYEDDDEFNMTLRTPLQPLGSLRSQIVPRRLVSLPSGSSVVSVPSRLSTLTTADDCSSLRTHTSSESDSFAASNSSPASVIGKKRSYPRTKVINIKNRVRQIEIEDRGPDEIANPDLWAIVPSDSRRRPNTTDSSDIADDPKSYLKSSAEEPDKEQVPPEEKRRKVTRSSSRVVTASRPTIKRYTSPPPQTTKSKLFEAPVGSKRPSSRMKSGSRSYPVQGTDASSSASTSDLPPPSVPQKSNTRLTRKR